MKRLDVRIGFLLNIMLLIACFYRSINPDALFGIDVFFSFLIAQILGIMPIAMWMSQDKFMNYLQKKFETLQFTDDSVIQRVFGNSNTIRFARRASLASSIVDWFASQLLWVSALLDDRQIAVLMVRLCLIIYAIKNVYNTLVIYATFSIVIRDMEKLKSIRNNSMETVDLSSFVIWINKKLPMLRQTRRSTLVGTTFVLLIFHLPAVFTDIGIQNLKYFFPALFLVWSLSNLTIFRGKMIKMKKIGSRANVNVVVIQPSTLHDSTDRIASKL